MDVILLEECVSYFRQYPVYQQLFEGLRRKYISLSKVGGKVWLHGLSIEEMEQLQGFLGFLKADQNGDICISAEKFCKALEGSRFSLITLTELLEAYFGEPIETRNKQVSTFQNQWDTFFHEVQEENREQEFLHWLMKCLDEKKKGYAMIRKKYKENPAELKEALGYLNKAITAFPIHFGKKKKLPVFAAEITGNPHYFDDGTFPGKLLGTYLRNVSSGSDVDMQTIQNSFTPAEKNWNYYYDVGLIRDDLWNYVLTYGIEGDMQDGAKHAGRQGFAKQGEPVHISLMTLGNLVRADARDVWVYVVENPSVFSALIERFPKKISAICTNGQLHLSSVVLMDMLKKNGVQFLYGGDFDPEGLGIADRLKQRYGESLSLWNYKKEYYDMSKSDVELGESRIVQLDNLKSEELCEIKDCLRKERMAGYQEKLIETYCREILENIY